MSKAFTYGDLALVRSAVNLSPELLAPYFGLTNMTLRRWALQKDLNKIIPEKHTAAIRNGLFRLYSEGKISIEDRSVRHLLDQMQPLYFGMVLNSFGVDIKKLENKDFRKSAVNFLNMVAKESIRSGSATPLRDQLKAIRAKTRQFASEIAMLVRIAEGKVKIPRKSRAIALGALIYLIVPFDLVPDSLPGLGLLDDFALLRVAISYYGLVS